MAQSDYWGNESEITSDMVKVIGGEVDLTLQPENLRMSPDEVRLLVSFLIAAADVVEGK